MTKELSRLCKLLCLRCCIENPFTIRLSKSPQIIIQMPNVVTSTMNGGKTTRIFFSVVFKYYWNVFHENKNKEPRPKAGAPNQKPLTIKPYPMKICD